MAIVPNLNGVQISNQVPLVDPRNLSFKERLIQDDNYASTTQFALANNNQLVIDADPTRNQLLFANPIPANATVYVSTSALAAAGGLPIVGGEEIRLKGKVAQLAYYCWGVAGQTLTIMEG